MVAFTLSSHSDAFFSIAKLGMDGEGDARGCAWLGCAWPSGWGGSQAAEHFVHHGGRPRLDGLGLPGQQTGRDAEHRSPRRSGDALHQRLRGGAGLFADTGGGAHRPGASARAHDFASAGAIFSEGQPASAGGHGAGDWPRTHYNRRAVERGWLRERVSRQVAHRTERRAAGEGGAGAFAAQSGIRHQYRRRVVRWPAEFLLAVPQCNAAGRRAGRVPAGPAG